MVHYCACSRPIIFAVPLLPCPNALPTFIALPCLHGLLHGKQLHDNIACALACAGAENAVSMKRLISHMRKERIGMVQTVQQYVFIYQAICDEIQQAFPGGRSDSEPGQFSASTSRSVSGSLSMASSSSQG